MVRMVVQFICATLAVYVVVYFALVPGIIVVVSYGYYIYGYTKDWTKTLISQCRAFREVISFWNSSNQITKSQSVSSPCSLKTLIL